MDGRYLHAPDARTRRWSAVVYSVATGAAALGFAGWDGLEHLGAGRFLDAAWLALLMVPVWWIVAGIGLRIVGRSRRPSDVGRSVG